MSGFTAGSVEVICPNCGAPVIVPVKVAFVQVNEYSSSSNLTVHTQEINSTSHDCKKVGR